MTVLTPPPVFGLPSRFSFAPIANTQSGGRSPFDGTEQWIRQPGERWGAQLAWEGLTQDEWRPLLAFLTQLGGRAGRFAWSPATLMPRRAAGIAGRTNWIPNGQFAGAGVGVLPNGWTFTIGVGATMALAATGTDANGTWVEITFGGTPTGNFCGAFRPASAAAAIGQVWTGACTLQTIGTITNIANIRPAVHDVSAGGAFGTASFGTGTPGALGSPTRREVTRTLADVRAGFGVDVRATTPGAAIALTLRVWTPQLERAAAATAYIATSTGPETVLEGPFVNGANQAGGTLALRGFAGGAEAFRAGDLLGFTDPNGRLRLHMATADAVAAEAGTVSVPIAPPLRLSPANSAVVAIAAPTAVWGLASDRTPMEILRGLIAGGTLDIEERVR